MGTPSLNMLRAFEAAARLGSFAAAADELCVTPAAVGQLVRKLEDQIDRQLFHRRGKRLLLTEAGNNVLPKFSAAFRDLDNAVLELQGTTVPFHITISVPPSFATGWLSGRIADFADMSEKLNFSIRAEEDPVDFERDSIDARLTYGEGHYPGLQVKKLMQDVAIPVCMPELLEVYGDVTTPEEMFGLPLIHTQWQSHQASYPSWQRWAKEHCKSQQMPTVSSEHVANNSKLAIDLATSGLGVALAQWIYVYELINAGVLVCPIDRALSFDAPYCLAIPAKREHNLAVLRFESWLKSRLQDDIAQFDLGLR